MGFFVAPVIGSLSDSCHSKFGRRRPYMLGGLLLLGLFSILLACTKYFGSAVLPIACICFVCLDGTINVIQTPLRALIADFAPINQQSTGQLMAVAFQGMGGLLGSLLQLLFYKDPNDVMVLFVSVFIVNIIFVGITSYFVREHYFPKPEGEKVSVAAPFIDLFKSTKGLTGKLLIVGATTFFCWWALFSWWPTSSTWYTEVVMDGCCSEWCEVNDPSAYARCQEGLTISANVNIAANVLQTLICIGFALLMNRGILVRVKFLWSILLTFGAALLIVSKFVDTMWYAYLVGIGMAIPISGINSFPLEVGKQFVLLNLFIVVPQIICTLMIGTLSEQYGVEGMTWALFAA
eukprot:Pgem_evm1s15188